MARRNIRTENICFSLDLTYYTEIRRFRVSKFISLDKSYTEGVSKALAAANEGQIQPIWTIPINPPVDTPVAVNQASATETISQCS